MCVCVVCVCVCVCGVCVCVHNRLMCNIALFYAVLFELYCNIVQTICIYNNTHSIRIYKTTVTACLYNTYGYKY